jgi:hypothetical protein
MRCRSCAVVLVVLGCRLAPDEERFESRSGVGGGSSTATDDDAAPATAAAGGSRAPGSSEVGGRSSSPGGSSTPYVGGSAPGDPGTAPSDAEGGAASSAAGDSSALAPSLPVSPGTREPPPPVVCDAQAVTLDEIRAGEVRDSVKVRLDAVATSQKFLVSHARSGSCLFGAFVGAEPAADGPRGVLVVSFGDDAPEGEPCAPGRDAIPDELAPGDAVTSVGYLSPYAPSACNGTAPSPQLMVDVGCSLSRTGRRMLPAPYDLSLDDASALARGTDAPLVRRFAGGLIRLEGVTALRPDEGVGSVAPYGVIRFAETTLELHNDLEYGDLTLGGPGDPAKSLAFAYPARFTSVTGLAYLDYCTWALTPRSRCADLDPPSDGCR